MVRKKIVWVGIIWGRGERGMDMRGGVWVRMSDHECMYWEWWGRKTKEEYRATYLTI